MPINLWHTQSDDYKAFHLTNKKNKQMKTSNKLLLLLLVLLFLVPLMMMMGFKAAIKNNQYVAKNMNGYNAVAFKNLGPFKAIKINGGVRNVRDDFGLRCTIRYGDKYGYKFNDYDPQQFEEGRLDSCNVSIAGDTLVVNYSIKANELYKSNYYFGIQMEITIPETMPIVANAAKINVDSSAAGFSFLDFALTNKAELHINGNVNPHTVIKEGNSYSVIPKAVFPKIIIDATTSKINLEENSAVKNLQVSLKGPSRLDCNEKAIIDTLSGSISDESVLNAPYNLVKKLK